MNELEMTVVNTDIYSIDLESLKQLAADPNVLSAEIRGSGDVYIGFRDLDRR